VLGRIDHWRDRATDLVPPKHRPAWEWIWSDTFGARCAASPATTRRSRTGRPRVAGPSCARSPWHHRGRNVTRPAALIGL
jgi:hypothetical protein